MGEPRLIALLDTVLHDYAPELDQYGWIRQTQGSLLEAILTRPDLFGLEDASPLQRAICRIWDGVPLGDLAADETVARAVGGAAAIAELPRGCPKEVVLLSGIRCGKSLLAAACAVRAALTCDVSRLGPGEVPRVSVLSVNMDSAGQTWAHIRGRVESSPLLAGLLVREPTADSLYLRHPTGRPVEIRVVAGSRAASTLVSRWSAGLICDEAPRMVGAEDGVVNLDDARHAIAGRLLPGAQVQLIGSPWAPFGPVYQLVEDFWGKPSPALVVVRGRASHMNPQWWTPDRVTELRETNPDAYQTDELGEFLDPVAGLMTLDELKACQRAAPEVLPPAPGHHYSAAIDPGTRNNAWTMVVTTTLPGGEYGTRREAVVLARQWVGSASAPLSPSAVFGEIAGLLKPYGVGTVASDSWAADAMRDVASSQGLGLICVSWTRSKKLEVYKSLAGKVRDRRLELAPVPLLLRDLSQVRRRVTLGGIAIELPETSDGRHCDFAPALALALSRPAGSPEPQPPAPGTPEAEKAEADAMRERARLEVQRRVAQRWKAYRQ